LRICADAGLDFADVIALALKPNEVARNAADTIVMIVFI
jgi:hypothetical protein